jgi:hypothetical protein
MSFTPVVARPRGEHGVIVSTSEALAWVLAVVAEVDGSGCRDWPGSRNPKGYGQMGYEGRTQQVGHVVLRLSGRPRPPAAHQLHACDRPVCAAPWHLRWGTNLENRLESATKGRTSRGEHRPTAKLTEAAVREIRMSGATLAELAIRFGVGITTIQKARVGDTWKHVVIEDGAVI